MKKVCSLLAIALLLSSCGMFRDVSKKVFRGKARTIVKKDSDSREVSKELDRGKVLTVDKGVTVTESTTTKTTERQGSNWNVTVDMLQLKGGGVITKDYAGTRLKVMLDSMGNLLLDIQNPGEVVTETTNTRVTENKDLTKNEQKDSERNAEKQVAVTSSNRQESDISVKDVDRKGKNAFWWMIAVVGGIAVAVWLVIRAIRGK